MKGKVDPVPLWAVRAVVAAMGGAQRADGLEAPLVGRDRELRLCQGPVPRRRGRRPSAAAGRRRRARCRQDPARVGVREVHRRPLARRAVAPRPLPGLRRGRRVLRAGRGGARPAALHRRGAARGGDRAGRARPRAGPAGPRRGRAGVAATPGRRAARRRLRRRLPARGPVLRMDHVPRAGRRRAPGGAGHRRRAARRRGAAAVRRAPALGRRLRLLRGAADPARPARGPADAGAEPPGDRRAPGVAAGRGHGRRCSTAWSPGCPTRCATSWWRAPRASRCTPSRRCAP